MVHLPPALRILCLTNLFCWMSLVSYSLYFTDFVGQAVYGGDPSASNGDAGRAIYDAGVCVGSLAMALYSVSCAIYSSRLEPLIEVFGAQRLYVYGQLVYALGAAAMAAFPSVISVFLFSPTAGVMYGTPFTMPYILVAHYHARDVFGEEGDGGG